MSLNLDRSTWTRVAFGDVVGNINDYFDPARDGALSYVAGPHIHIGEVIVASYGSTADDNFPPTFKRKFRNGDVLLHSRGIEKLASVDRDGVTGEKLFVLRSKDQSLLIQPFLVWLLLSAQAREHMQANFTGSVNKFLNWKPLAAMEIDLPAVDEQRRIADLLWAVERHQESEARTRARLEEAIGQFCLNAHEQALRAYPLGSFNSVGELRMGRQKAPKYMTGVGSTPYLRVANVGALELDLTTVEEMDFNERDLARFRLEPGDVLLTEGDIVSALNVGRPAIYEGQPAQCAFQNTLIRFRPLVGSDPHFYAALFEGMRLAGVFVRAASTTTVTHLGLGRLSEVPLPQVPMTLQSEIGAQLRSLLMVRAELDSGRVALTSLRAALLADLFGGK